MLKADMKVQKRGGMRRPVRRKPKQIGRGLTAEDYYKDSKSTGLFPKRLGQYRILICSDFEPDDLAALTMLTAWIKVNERYYDSRNNFPIYGFVVGESENKRIKAQRAREFLQEFADMLGWDDTEHHLYSGYNSAGSRVWHDGNSANSFVGEEKLLDNADILNDPDYPDPEPFITKIDELMELKPSNLFILYLKPLRFFESLQNRPEVFDYLRQVPSAIYGGWNVRSILANNPDLKEPITQFLNRGPNDAPLIFAESYHAIGPDNTINPSNAEKLFHEFEEAGEDELIHKVKQCMYVWNDNILNDLSAKLQDIPELEDVDFDDYQSFIQGKEHLSAEQLEKYDSDLKIVESIIKHDANQFVYADPLVIIAVLMATKTLTITPFRLQPSVINYDNGYASVNLEHDSNTHVLLPKEKLTKKHVKTAKQLLEGMLVSAVKITNGN